MPAKPKPRTDIYASVVAADASSIFSTTSGSLVGGSASSLTQSSDVTFTTADGAATTTVGGTVSLSGVFTRLVEGRDGEMRPLAKQTFKLSLGADPGVALGRALASNDVIAWNGLDLLVVGTAIPDGGGGWQVIAELVA